MPRKYTRKQPPPPQVEQLKPNTADDTDGDTVPVSAKISPSEKAALDALPGARSKKIRQAIREYISRQAEGG